MYGTVARCRVRPGSEEAYIELSKRWNRERGPQVPGFIAEYVYRSEANPGEFFACLLFESKDAYLRNAGDPEEDRWYQRFRELMEADAEWNDGQVVNHA
jgi:quinol monooxygenase YgiN